jgi:hypothetical protein
MTRGPAKRPRRHDHGQNAQAEASKQNPGILPEHKPDKPEHRLIGGGPFRYCDGALPSFEEAFLLLKEFELTVVLGLQTSELLGVVFNVLRMLRDLIRQPFHIGC